MNKPLLELSTQELLEKFGLGNHKPGSGSAAALEGMLAGKLALTVISLSVETEKRRAKYGHIVDELYEAKTDIENNIYPELVLLFEKDSQQFDLVIAARTARDNATDVDEKSKLAGKALSELKVSTVLPIRIASECVKVGYYAALCCKEAFRPARGDSSVALNGALAAVSGCLSIIELNLLSFTWDNWVSDIRAQVDELKLHHKRLKELADDSHKQLENANHDKRKTSFTSILNELQSGRWEETRVTDEKIEEIAKSLQNTLWLYRDYLWKDNIPGELIDVLVPEIAIKDLLGYSLSYGNLGRTEIDGAIYEVAGEIDKSERAVKISNKFSGDVSKFTLAHELGHIMFHKGLDLHRDRGLDGSTPGNLDYRERQANKFAAFFLMPERLVVARFQMMFGVDRFEINDNSVFWLNEGRPSEFRSKVRNDRGLANYLALVDQYRGQVFLPIHKVFKVSVGAMAIRLIELGLVGF